MGGLFGVGGLFGGQQPRGSTEYTDFNPQDMQALRESVAHNKEQVSAAQGQIGSLSNNFNSNFGQYGTQLNSSFGQHAPQLNTNFQGPQFGNDLDSFSQNMISQGANANQQKLATQQGQLQQQFGGKNPALAGILSAQAASNSQMGQNPMAFQAAAAQRARQGQEFQLQQQSQALGNAAQLAQGQEGSRLQSLGNATQLQQSQNNANLQGMGNAALGQQAQLAAFTPMLQGGLTSILAQVAQMTGKRTAAPQAPNNSGVDQNGYDYNNRSPG